MPECRHGVLRQRYVSRSTTTGHRLSESADKRTGEFLQANSGLWFCDGCLALKIGVSLQAMQDVIVTIARFRGYRVEDHRWSVCRRLKEVIRAVADSPRRR